MEKHKNKKPNKQPLPQPLCWSQVASSLDTTAWWPTCQILWRWCSVNKNYLNLQLLAVHACILSLVYHGVCQCNSVSLCIHLTDLWNSNRQKPLAKPSKPFNRQTWEARMRAVAPSLHGKSTEAFAASSTSTMSLRCRRANGCDVRSCQVLVLVKVFVGICWDMLGQLTQLLTAVFDVKHQRTVSLHSRGTLWNRHRSCRVRMIQLQRHARRVQEGTWGKKRMEKDQGWKKTKESCLTARDVGCQESKRCLQMITVFTAMQQLPVPRIGMKWYLRLRRKE